MVGRKRREGPVEKKLDSEQWEEYYTDEHGISTNFDINTDTEVGDGRMGLNKEITVTSVTETALKQSGLSGVTKC